MLPWSDHLIVAVGIGILVLAVVGGVARVIRFFWDGIVAILGLEDRFREKQPVDEERDATLEDRERRWRERQ